MQELWFIGILLYIEQELESCQHFYSFCLGPTQICDTLGF